MSEGVEITVNKFSERDISPQEYNPGDQVTRENFTSMLIKSFYISQANLLRQELFFKWIQAKTGFNYESAINNFFSAGGWDCLSSEEQNSFKNHLGKVAGHEESGAVKEFYRDPKDTLYANISVNFYNDDTIAKAAANENFTKFTNRYGKLAGMDFQRLVANLNDFKPNPSVRRIK